MTERKGSLTTALDDQPLMINKPHSPLADGRQSPPVSPIPPSSSRVPVVIVAQSPSLRFVFASAVVQTAGVAAVVPSLALQLEAMHAAPELLGFVSGIAPLASVLSPLACGVLVDRARRVIPGAAYTLAHALSLTLFSLGNLMFVLADDPYTLISARCFVGCSMGNIALGGAQIGREVKARERLGVVSLFTSIEMLGFIFGTALGGFISAAFEDGASLFGLRVTAFTAPSLFFALCGALLATFGLGHFSKHEMAMAARMSARRLSTFRDIEDSGDALDRGGAKLGGMGNVADGVGGVGSGVGSVMGSNGGAGGVGGGSGVGSGGSSSGIGSSNSAKNKQRALSLSLLLYFIVAATYNAVETTTGATTHHAFGWTVTQNAVLWTVSGLVGTATAIGVGMLPPTVVRPVTALVAALVACVVAPLVVNASLMLPRKSTLQLGLFWLGFLAFDIGYVVSECVLTTIFASHVDEEDGSKDEAFLFGLFNALGWYLASAVGAVVGNYLYILSPEVMWNGCAAASLAVLCTLLACRHRLFANMRERGSSE